VPTETWRVGDVTITKVVESDAAAVLSDSVRPIFDAGLATFFEPSAHLVPEVALIPSHGHTPGHVAVSIESKGETAVITGDCCTRRARSAARTGRAHSTPTRMPPRPPGMPSSTASPTPRRW
jgi:glyoxylase-like metal-dependent hydrolase (beta-lactamase superfamily II)